MILKYSHTRESPEVWEFPVTKNPFLSTWFAHILSIRSTLPSFEATSRLFNEFSMCVYTSIHVNRLKCPLKSPLFSSHLINFYRSYPHLKIFGICRVVTRWVCSLAGRQPVHFSFLDCWSCIVLSLSTNWLSSTK